MVINFIFFEKQLNLFSFKAYRVFSVPEAIPEVLEEEGDIGTSITADPGPTVQDTVDSKTLLHCNFFIENTK